MTAQINMRRTALALAFVITSPLAAQQVNRDVAPTPPASPKFNVPKWTRVKLSNGADLIVSEKHDLPLVSFSINFVGGSYQYEPADKTGLANFAAAMLSEGTTSKTAEQ